MTYRKMKYPAIAEASVNTTMLNISCLRFFTSSKVQIPFVLRKYITTLTERRASPPNRNIQALFPYKVSARVEATETVPSPNSTIIIGEKQHNDARTTGSDTILKTSFVFCFINYL